MSNECRKIKDGKAYVIPFLCVGCGACEQVCPEGATEMIERPQEVLEKQLKPLRSFAMNPPHVHSHAH